MSEPIFEFTFGGNRFKIHSEGCVKIAPSEFPAEVQVIINRFPQFKLVARKSALIH